MVLAALDLLAHPHVYGQVHSIAMARRRLVSDQVLAEQHHARLEGLPIFAVTSLSLS